MTSSTARKNAAARAHGPVAEPRSMKASTTQPPPEVAAIQQLGARYSWFDLTQVGVYGWSGGGLASAAAMLHHSDFFKVGVSVSGNHDDRTESIVVGESRRGLLERDEETDDDNYEGDANHTLAANLLIKGKPLLMAGDLEEAVHPAQTLRLASALIDADRKLDLMILPDHGHWVWGTYATRMMFDYFVRHFLGLEPPEYSFQGMNVRRPANRLGPDRDEGWPPG